MEKVEPKYENTEAMFYGCSSLKEFTFPATVYLDPQTVKSMFENCTSLERLDLSALATYSCTDYRFMFKNCSNLTEVTLSDDFYIDYYSAETSDMFTGAASNNIIGGYPTMSIHGVTDSDLRYLLENIIAWNQGVWVNMD